MLQKELDNQMRFDTSIMQGNIRVLKEVQTVASTEARMTVTPTVKPTAKLLVR